MEFPGIPAAAVQRDSTRRFVRRCERGRLRGRRHGQDLPGKSATSSRTIHVPTHSHPHGRRRHAPVAIHAGTAVRGGERHCWRRASLRGAHQTSAKMDKWHVVMQTKKRNCKKIVFWIFRMVNICKQFQNTFFESRHSKSVLKDLVHQR